MKINQIQVKPLRKLFKLVATLETSQKTLETASPPSKPLSYQRQGRQPLQHTWRFLLFVLIRNLAASSRESRRSSCGHFARDFRQQREQLSRIFRRAWVRRRRSDNIALHWELSSRSMSAVSVYEEETRKSIEGKAVGVRFSSVLSKNFVLFHFLACIRPDRFAPFSTPLTVLSPLSVWLFEKNASAAN